MGAGGFVGVILGNLTINSGGAVSADAEQWSLGYGAAACVSAIAVNGGVLAFSDTNTASNNGGLSAGSITMTGGTISGYACWYNGITNTPTLTTNPSNTTAVISGGLNLRLGSTGNLTFNVAQGNTGGADLVVSGSIASDGAGENVIKTGPGMLSLTGTNNYNGTTTINGGILQVSSAAALSNYSTYNVANYVTVASGGTLLLAAGGSGWSGTNIASLNTTAFQAGSTLGIDTTGGSTTVSGAIAGSEGLSVQGNNTLTLSGNNTFTGGTTVNAGTLARWARPARAESSSATSQSTAAPRSTPATVGASDTSPAPASAASPSTEARSTSPVRPTAAAFPPAA